MYLHLSTYTEKYVNSIFLLEKQEAICEVKDLTV